MNIRSPVLLCYNSYMFTGIVEELGQVSDIRDNSISVSCKKILSDIKIGDSIAVDGVCLTVTSFNASGFVADVSYETKRVTKLANLKNYDPVNLERALLLSSRLGGHIVSGHVDCVAEVYNLASKGDFYELKIKVPDGFSQYYVKKGSITIDGISLTIADISNNIINVAVIPHTYEATNLSSLKKGDAVNIEFDILAKYVEKNLLMNDNKNNITMDFLEENGFV